jgi:hypothetical protein
MSVWRRDPWEWVEGDPALSTKFRLLILGGLLGTVLVSVPTLLNLLGLGGTWPPFILPPPALSLAVTLGSLLGTSLVPRISRNYPILYRIGIGPSGLRLGSSPMAVVHPWARVSGVGRDWVELRHVGMSQRFKLTLPQAARLRAYLRVGEAAVPRTARPLPSAPIPHVSG